VAILRKDGFPAWRPVQRVQRQPAGQRSDPESRAAIPRYVILYEPDEAKKDKATRERKISRITQEFQTWDRVRYELEQLGLGEFLTEKHRYLQHTSLRARLRSILKKLR